MKWICLSASSWQIANFMQAPSSYDRHCEGAPKEPKPKQPAATLMHKLLIWCDNDHSAFPGRGIFPDGYPLLMRQESERLDEFYYFHCDGQD